jgi:hypothetical protein
MKLNSQLFLLAALIISNFMFAQKNEEQKALNDETIENQFDYIIKKSSNYQKYKVIKKTWIYSLKSHVVDSLKKEKNRILELKSDITNQKNKFSNLQKDLTAITKQLEEETNSKNSISLFGVEFDKSTFKIIIGLIIGGLLIALFYFIYSFRNANKTTQKALTDYTELDAEFNTARTRALEREQILNRKLQDQLNKHKNS